MNLNELLAQQQALLQNAQNWQFVYLALGLLYLLFGLWVVYMFYARLRDIADELRKIRVTYEMEQDRTIRNAARPRVESSAENPFSGNARYMPPK